MRRILRLLRALTGWAPRGPIVWFVVGADGRRRKVGVRRVA